ncbi:MAG: cytosine permease [Acetobacter sp.]
MTQSDVSYLEHDTIYPIPPERRHGTAGHLFALWFGANVRLLTLVTGSLATTSFHLGFVSAACALFLGNVVGAVFMAAHAAQGPRLGVPQMIQSRGQFGTYGSALVTVVVVMMYTGYTASNAAVAGRSIHGAFPWVATPVIIALVGAVALGIAIMGHDIIHRCGRVTTVVAAATLVLCFGVLMVRHVLPPDILSHGVYSTQGFLGALSVAALWQISYAPYVSDYSRYLPQRTGAAPAFWGTWGGVVVGAVPLMLLGALMGVLATDGDVVGALTRSLGPFAAPAIVLLTVTLACCGAIDIYGGMLASITLLQTFAPDWRPGLRARVGFCIFIAVLGIGMAIGAQADFLHSYMNFLFLLLCVLIPWTAINLVDYYLIHHGDYDVSSFFKRDGGIYGRINTTALIAYGVGIAVQMPFVATDLYTGPIARALGGADLSWIVGLVVVSPLYYGLCRLEQARAVRRRG